MHRFFFFFVKYAGEFGRIAGTASLLSAGFPRSVRISSPLTVCTQCRTTQPGSKWRSQIALVSSRIWLPDGDSFATFCATLNPSGRWRRLHSTLHVNVARLASGCIAMVLPAWWHLERRNFAITSTLRTRDVYGILFSELHTHIGKRSGANSHDVGTTQHYQHGVASIVWISGATLRTLGETKFVDMRTAIAMHGLGGWVSPLALLVHFTRVSICWIQIWFPYQSWQSKLKNHCMSYFVDSDTSI